MTAAAISQPIESVEWEAPLVDRQPDLERELRRTMGRLPPGGSYFAPIPWIVRALEECDYNRGRLAYGTIPMAERTALVVSHDNSCRYCFAAHRALMRFAGTPEERIRRLEQDILLAASDPAERAALEFARKLSRSNPLITAVDVEALRAAGHVDGAIKELALVAGIMVFSNRIATIPALPAERLERIPDRWYARLTRPLIGFALQRGWGPGSPSAVPAERNTGPFAYLVEALDGVPLAAGLRRMLDDCFAAPRLPPRSRALVFAVVARGLGAARAEREATRLLVEGGLAEETIAQVLAHLSSSELDALEVIASAFARETLWYRPAALQRRAREVRDALATEEFLDLVGVAALANMVCRLDPLAEIL